MIALNPLRQVDSVIVLARCGAVTYLMPENHASGNRTLSYVHVSVIDTLSLSTGVRTVCPNGFSGASLQVCRCIKPNYHLKPNTFDQSMILQQLRCCGVLEVVRIAKAGYPTRYEHRQFVDRYIELMPRSSQSNGDTLVLCRALLDYFRVPEAMWQIGHTKIFFRAGVLGTMEDLWRRTKGAVQLIQAQVRMHIARTRFLRLRKASTVIAAHRRGQLQRRKFNVELAEHRAAIRAQAAARRWLARHEAKRRLAAIVTIQCGLRKVQFRKRCAVREADMRQALEFAQNRALRAKEKMINMEKELAEWHKIKADFQMDPDQVRDALMAWRAQPEGGSQASSVTATGPGLSEQDQKLKLFQVHREAFFAWQMGSGTNSAEPSTEEEQNELQVHNRVSAFGCCCLGELRVTCCGAPTHAHALLLLK